MYEALTVCPALCWIQKQGYKSKQNRHGACSQIAYRQKSLDRAMHRYYGSSSGKGLCPTGVRESFPDNPLEVMTTGSGWQYFARWRARGRMFPAESNGKKHVEMGKPGRFTKPGNPGTMGLSKGKLTRKKLEVGWVRSWRAGMCRLSPLWWQEVCTEGLETDLHCRKASVRIMRWQGSRPADSWRLLVGILMKDDGGLN